MGTLKAHQIDRARTESGVRRREVVHGVVLGDRYRVEHKLAEGGMGSIFVARDLHSHRAVAVKLLREDARHAQIRQRFLNEARATMSIQNPHVVEILDVGELSRGETFYVMELLDGKPLDECGPFGMGTILSIALQLCDGLAAAHRQGVVHRDLKPENVIVTTRSDGSVNIKIIDFGIAKMAFSGELTLPGQIMGTPHYLAPEQARATGNEIDGRTDIYGMGLLLYELLSGALPFDGDNILELLLAHQHNEPPPLDPMVCPPRLAEVVMRCLRKNPAERFASMDALAAALRAAVPTLSNPPEALAPADPEEAATVIRAVVVSPRAPSKPPSLPNAATMFQPPVPAAHTRWIAPMLVLCMVISLIALSFAILTT